MSSIFNAQLSESSDVYHIINVILTEAKYILPSAKYIALPNEVALELKNHLNQGMSISIKKELVDNPVSKDIPLDHFEIKKPSSLGAKKSALKAKAHQVLVAKEAFVQLLVAEFDPKGEDSSDPVNAGEAFAVKSEE